MLPLHETSSVPRRRGVHGGANFILLGSTKVVAILAIYHDLSVGLVCRGFGGLLGMATPEADAETRGAKVSELAERQSSGLKAVMLDAGLDKAARESNVAEIASRYAALMEDTKSAADAQWRPTRRRRWRRRDKYRRRDLPCR